MVRAKLQYYYTFKIISAPDAEQLVVEVHKWEEETGAHSGTTYKTKPFLVWMACSCPATRKCKHLKCAEEAVETGKAQEFWKWRWDEKNGWRELDDIPPVEDMNL